MSLKNQHAIVQRERRLGPHRHDSVNFLRKNYFFVHQLASTHGVVTVFPFMIGLHHERAGGAGRTSAGSCYLGIHWSHLPQHLAAAPFNSLTLLACDLHHFTLLEDYL